MTWPRPRITVRRLMVLIAILAISFGAISGIARLRARSYAYRQRAYGFRLSTVRSGSAILLPDGRLVGIWENQNTRREDERAWQMAAKYQRLSYYPWLDADPDPPPPQPLEHARPGRELPPPDITIEATVRNSRPPIWTFLWTSHWLKPLLLE